MSIKSILKSKVERKNNLLRLYCNRLDQCCANKYNTISYKALYGCFHKELDFDELYKIFCTLKLEFFYLFKNNYTLHKEFIKPHELTTKLLYDKIHSKYKFKEQIVLLYGRSGGMRFNDKKLMHLFDDICNDFIDGPYTLNGIQFILYIVDANKYINDMSLINTETFKEQLDDEIPYFKKHVCNNSIYS